MVLYGVPKRSGRYPWKKTPVWDRIKHTFWMIWGRFLYKIGYLKDDEA